MRALHNIAPWKRFPLGPAPWPGFWAFNPSVLRRADGQWLCSVRCANYHLPGSTIQASSAIPLVNRNVIAELDPDDNWRVSSLIEMTDLDAKRGAYRSSRTFGFEDLRLVENDGALCAIANTMVLNDHGTLEIARLALDAEYQIVGVFALRGSSWQNQHQKNWSPYQRSTTFEALYSVSEGGIHDLNGRIVQTHKTPDALADDPVFEPIKDPRRTRSNYTAGATHVQIGPARHRTPPPKQKAFKLRGGSQLIEVDDKTWLGIGHGCHVSVTKHYWHRFYTVDESGYLLRLSEPFKLDPEVGIEFAAGMDVDGDRLAVSFGVEDDSAWIGETSLTAVLDLLKPISVTG